MTFLPAALLVLATAGAPAAPGTVAVPPSSAAVFPYPGDASRSKGPATLRLIETGRQRTPGTVEVDYRLEASGFPRGKIYELWQLALDGPAEKLCGALAADSSGALVPDDAAAVHEASLCGPFGDIVVGAYQYMPGEPYRVAIVSTDSTVRAVATAFPHPIEGADGPYRLLLEMTSADRRSFVVWGVGFPRDATLTTVLTSAGESFQGGAFADEHGVLRLHLDAPPDAPGGVATYEVRGKQGSPKVTYRWGSSRASTDGRATAPAAPAGPGR
jgi:hypothetical protein